jgi:hypothetical protein
MSRPIAHVGPNLPQDLLRATGRHAGALPFEAERPTPTADRWMESKFAPWAKAILEGWVAGDYDHLGQVLFSRADDSAQRLYYYLCELQRRGLAAGPEPLILDIAKVPRATSVMRNEFSLRKLAERLSVSHEQLADAIAACNAERAPGPPVRAERPCLLAGTPPPDRRLHDAAASAGFTMVGLTLIETWTQLGEVVESDGVDSCLALARQVHAEPAGPRSFAEAGAALERAIVGTGARAVVLWQVEEDEAQAWHLPAQRAALARLGLPALVMTRRDWLARDGAGDEIVAFLRGIPS